MQRRCPPWETPLKGQPHGQAPQGSPAPLNSTLFSLPWEQHRLVLGCLSICLRKAEGLVCSSLLPAAGPPRPPSERGPHGTATVVHVCVASARPAGRRLSRARHRQRRAQQSGTHVARTSVSASACPSECSTERPPRPPAPARLPSALLCSRDDRGGDDRRRPVPEAGPRGTARAAASLVMTSPRW